MIYKAPSDYFLGTAAIGIGTRVEINTKKRDPLDFVVCYLSAYYWDTYDKIEFVQHNKVIMNSISYAIIVGMIFGILQISAVGLHPELERQRQERLRTVSIKELFKDGFKGGPCNSVFISTLTLIIGMGIYGIYQGGTFGAKFLGAVLLYCGGSIAMFTLYQRYLRPGWSPPRAQNNMFNRTAAGDMAAVFN